MSATMEISLGADLTAEQAEEIFNQGKEAVIFALLELAKKLAEQQSPAKPTPSTPSGMVPPYEKPSAKTGGKRKPGRKKVIRAPAVAFRTRFITPKSTAQSDVRSVAAS